MKFIRQYGVTLAICLIFSGLAQLYEGWSLVLFSVRAIVTSLLLLAVLKMIEKTDRSEQ